MLNFAIEERQSLTNDFITPCYPSGVRRILRATPSAAGSVQNIVVAQSSYLEVPVQGGPADNVSTPPESSNTNDIDAGKSGLILPDNEKQAIPPIREFTSVIIDPRSLQFCPMPFQHTL